MRRIFFLGEALLTNTVSTLTVLILLIFSAQSSYAAVAFRAASSARVQTQVGVTPSFIQDATSTTGGGAATSLTVAKPAGTLTNHVMVAQITIKGVVASITPPANWNLINNSSTSTSGSEITQAVYWHVAIAGEPASYTWSWMGSARAAGGIATFSNVETANPVDVSAVRITNNNATITVPAITTTSGNEMLMALLGSSTASSHSTVTGMNENYDVSTVAGPNGVTVSNNTFLQVPAGAVAAKTATTGSAADNIAHIIALRPLGALTINVPAGTTTNDVMIASISYRPCSNTSGGNCTTTISPPAGWIQVNSTTDQKTGGGTDGYGNRLFIYQRVVTGIEPASYTWYFGGTPMQAGAAGGIASFSGVDTVTPIDVQAGQATASSRTHTAPSITTTAANTMLVSSHLINSSGTWTPPAGMTERVDIASRTPTDDLGITLEINTEARAAISATGTRSATASNPPAADTGITHMLALRPVPTGLNHLEIQHGSGTGLTCAASTLTIKACADAAVPCVSPYTSGVGGTLNATGTPAVNWAGGSGVFAIAVGSSSVTMDVQVSSAGSVIFGVASPAPVPSNATTCNFGSPLCTYTASLAGFIFSNTATGNSYTIPVQISGIATPTLYLRAVQASTTNPAVCTPAIISQTSTANMGYTCNDPATCQTGNLVTINSTTIAGSPNSNPTQNSTSVSLDFDANGSAPITARYDDVGQITLNANKTVTPFGGATAVTLIGNSNPFVVAPHHFGFSGITAGPIKAGNNFVATVTAYNGLAISTATPSFGKELVAESATIAFTKCQPTGTSAVNGTFSGNVGSFNNGAASANNLNWSEVGNGDLLATLSSVSYLGSGLTATGNTGTGGTVCSAGTGNVGRFIPDHFDTAIINGCLGCGFTYSGQPFTVFVTAMNGLVTPSIAVNYDGTANTAPNFAKAVTLSAWDAATGATQNPGPGALLPPVNTAVALTAFSQGVASLNTAATKTFYTFTTVPTIPTIIRVRSADTDGVTSLRVPLSSSIEGQPEIRSGRIKVANAYGSELLQLPVAVTAQYWKDVISGWLTSATDSSSNFVVATPPATSAVNFGTFKNNLTTISVVGSPKTVTLSNSNGGYALAAPGANKNGSVDMSIPALTGASCYVVPVPLGCYLPSNAARATFGVYKGGNNFIYQRENY